MRAAFIFCLIAGFVGAWGTAEARPKRSSTPRRAPARAPRAKPPAAAADPFSQIVAASPLIQRLTPVESGPGVVVCEPVPQPSATAEVADLGNGCARWLNLTVGGHGELGKTPLWGSTVHALYRMRRSDLRLDQATGARFARLLGLTHVALGQIQGDLDNCTLSYQIWDVGAKKFVGKPQVLTGTAQTVAAGLPRVAAGLAAGLAVRSPRVPAAVGETAEELQWLGAHPWAGISNIPRDRLEKLHNLALLAIPGTPESRAKPPFLAAFTDLMLHSQGPDISHVMTAAHAVRGALPDNALALAEISSRAANTGRASSMDLPLKAIQENLRRFPRNALYHQAMSNVHAVDQRRDEARKEAEWMVRCAPRSPTSWWNLGQRIFAQADAIRHGRFVTALTEEQMAYCQERYEEYVPVMIRAALLDPEDASLWKDASAAAAFAGEGETADSAFWKAVKLGPRAYATLWWGAQLYQPKWYEDSDKLTKVARLAATASADWSANQRVAIAWQIYYAGLPEEALPIVRGERERKALRDQVERYRKTHPDEEVPPFPEEQPDPAAPAPRDT